MVASKSSREIILTEQYNNIDIIKALSRIDPASKGCDENTSMWLYKDILANVENGSRDVNYRLKPYGVGRLYPKNSKQGCYQNMDSKARRLVLNGSATSVDGTNMHPCILKQLVRRYSNTQFPTLDAYVNDPDACRKAVMERHGVSHKIAKRLYIRMVFGGSYKTWAVKFGIKDEVSNDVKAFHEEMALIMKEVAPKFEGYKKCESIAAKNPSKDGKAIARSALAYSLQNTERLIMENVIDWANESGYTVTSLIHDEIHVEGKHEDINTSELSRYVSDKSTFSIDFTCEWMVPSEADHAWFRSLAPFITPDTDGQIGSYDEVKREFEKENFFISDIAEFGRYRADDKSPFLAMQVAKMNVKFHNKYFIEGGKKIKFLPRWLDDTERKTFNNVDFLPPPLLCKPDTFNLFKKFDIERDTSEPQDCARIL